MVDWKIFIGICGLFALGFWRLINWIRKECGQEKLSFRKVKGGNK